MNSSLISTPVKPTPFNLPETNCLIQPQVPLASMTSFRVGGPAEWFVSPQTLEELQESFAWAHHEGLPVTLLGAGSNLLISDQGLPGLVISTRHLRHLDLDLATGQMTVGAGYSVPRLARLAAEHGWAGLEWAVGIPGTVGGAVVMNAGAHQECTADRLHSVQVLSPQGTVLLLEPQDLGYGYRTSALQGGNQLVVQATFQLQPGADPEQVKAATEAHLQLKTQPYHLPSCGSVFRNPGPRTAGWLIERTGLKGFRIGSAQVAERHANFILNCGGATASDILRVIRHVQNQVSDRWSLPLKPEVKIVGDFPSAA
jgi:UDP-N-acetylmuramate dehydrogenase